MYDQQCEQHSTQRAVFIVFKFGNRKLLYFGQRSRHSDLLRAGRSGDRISVWARHSAPVQTDPGANSASHTIVTVSFLWVKRPERGVDHQPPSSVEVEGKVELYIFSPSGPSWPVLG
jgi:hypothetical protein